MRLFVIIGIIALNLTNYNAESQENPNDLHNVPNQKISASLQETLEKLGKMTNEQKLNALTELTYAANNFSLNLYKHFVSGSQENLVLSVFAIFQSLSLLAWASTGNTKQQIYEVLKLPKNEERIFAGFEEINRKLKQDAMWHWHNILIIKRDLHVTSDFKNISARIYSTKDFESVYQSPGTIVIASNALSYCNIRSDNIHLVTFTNMDGSKTMNQWFSILTGKYRQLPEIKATSVEILCKGKYKPQITEPKVPSTRMFILFPNRVNGFDELEKNIGLLNISKPSTGDLRDVNIVMPIKSQSSSSKIGDNLSRMGLTEMFSYNAEIFVSARRSWTIQFQNVGEHHFVNRNPLSAAYSNPRLNKEQVIVDRPFISVITTNDEIPLILHMSRTTSLQD